MRWTIAVAFGQGLLAAGCTVDQGAPSGETVTADASGETGAAGGVGADAAAGDASRASDSSLTEASTRDAASAADHATGFGATHPAWPQVVPNQGRVLKPMKLVFIVATGDPLASSLFAFADALVASQWWALTTPEYGVGAVSGAVHVLGPAIGANPDDTAMDSYIQRIIQRTPTVAPDGNTSYMLFLPPGITGIDSQNGLNTGCQYYGGYHVPFGTGGDARSVAQRCPLQKGGSTELQDLTITASHEIIESATDPQSGTGWNMGDPTAAQPWTRSPWIAGLQGEVGDLCTGTEWTEGSYTYQRVWSNAAARTGGDPCVPAYPGLSYYNTSAPKGWYSVASGGSVDIPLTGFSTAATTDWSLYVVSLGSSMSGFAGSVVSPKTLTQMGMTFEQTNNGGASTLTATAPPGAPSGSWGVLGVQSVPQAGVAGDPGHLWPVGVYVP